MSQWEYRLLSIASFEAPTTTPEGSAAVNMLNDEGKREWEAVGLTSLDSGGCAILMKRPVAGARQAGGRL